MRNCFYLSKSSFITNGLGQSRGHLSGLGLYLLGPRPTLKLPVSPSLLPHWLLSFRQRQIPLQRARPRCRFSSSPTIAFQKARGGGDSSRGTAVPGSSAPPRRRECPTRPGAGPGASRRRRSGPPPRTASRWARGPRRRPRRRRRRRRTRSSSRAPT